MAYNLPPPWDPGFALPGNVRAEGLEKRGFVTKWMPRGTYDQPVVGTGGYVVPQYVIDEGYGQGTFTTKWEPNGEYDGGAIPHWLNDRPKLISSSRRKGGGRNVSIAAPVTVMTYGNGSAVAMGDDAAPNSFTDYGNRVAAGIISQVAALPPPQRSKQLRKILDKLDRTLYKRTQDIAKTLVAQGATAGQAFRAALSRALSAGIAAEVITAGQTRATPHPSSLLGGAVARGQKTALGAIAGGAVSPTGLRALAPPAPPMPAGAMKIVGAPDSIPYFQSAKDGELVAINRGLNPAEVKWIIPGLLKAVAKTVMVKTAMAPGANPFGGPKINLADYPHAFPGAGGTVPYEVFQTPFPVFWATNPADGDQNYVVQFLWNGSDTQPQFNLIWHKVNEDWLGKILGGIDKVVMFIQKVADAVKDWADQQACNLVNKPGASGTIAATGGPYGVAIAGGMEVVKGAGLCDQAPPPFVPITQQSWFLPVAIGVGALGAVYLLTKKKPTP